MPAPYNLIGRRFGRLRVIGRGETVSRKVTWICQCDCDRVMNVRTSDLTMRKSVQCRPCSMTQHGHTRKDGWRSPEYHSWQAMKSRCLNPGDVGYKNYGGRGITICERWAKSFEAFLADLGPKPSRRHTIDRIDNNGNYKPGNVRWATWAQQAANRTKPGERAR